MSERGERKKLRERRRERENEQERRKESTSKDINKYSTKRNPNTSKNSINKQVRWAHPHYVDSTAVKVDKIFRIYSCIDC